jgi:outer membrane protein
MKNVNYVINGVLAVAVVILFIMQFSGKKESAVTKASASGESGEVSVLPIAYVNVDSLLINYNYFKDLNEQLLKKEENSRANVNQQARSLQTEVQEFYRKAENNAFLTRERMQQEQERLMKKEQELKDLDAKLTQELLVERQKLNEQLRDTIISTLKVYNKDKAYQMIFSNTAEDNILLAGDAYDITNELIDMLNKSYSGNK